MPTFREIFRPFHGDVIRRRGESIGRVEGFSDAVFGFAVTLLVISLNVPHDYASLIHLLARLPSFVAAFLVLFYLWHQHYTFFRRYGLEDGITMILNLVLLIVVVAYLYPLKFLFDACFQFIPGAPAIPIDVHQTAMIMVIYGIGYAAVNLAFTGLYRHAVRRADVLELGDEERRQTAFHARQYGFIVGVCVLSVAVALVVPPRDGAPMWSGLTYSLAWPTTLVNGWITARGTGRAPGRPAPGS